MAITARHSFARFSDHAAWDPEGPRQYAPRPGRPDNPRQATQSRVTNSQNARPAWSPYRAKRRRICASLTVFFPIDPRVLRTGPRIEDQSGVPADRHHDVRGRVRPHARERQQALLELRVGELVGRGGRQRLEVELAVGDRSGERAQIRTAVPRASDVAIEGLGRLGHPLWCGERVRERLAVADRRIPEVRHERVHHPHRRAPRAVRGADGLHHVLEDRRPLQHPARARRGPREVVVVRGLRVEVRQVVVEPEHVADAFATSSCTRTPAAGPRISTSACRGRPSRMRTRRGLPRRMRNVTASVRASSSSRVGESSANPWEFIVRHRSTGSPPGPTSGSCSSVVTPSARAAGGTRAPCSGCRTSASSTTWRNGSWIGRRRPSCTSDRRRVGSDARIRRARPGTRRRGDGRSPPRTPSTVGTRRGSSNRGRRPVSAAAAFRRRSVPAPGAAPMFWRTLSTSASRISSAHVTSASEMTTSLPMSSVLRSHQAIADGPGSSVVPSLAA